MGVLLAVALSTTPLDVLDRVPDALERLACYYRAAAALRAAEGAMSFYRAGSAAQKAAWSRWLVAYRDLATCRSLDALRRNR
jgi:hypothetical protein